MTGWERNQSRFTKVLELPTEEDASKKHSIVPIESIDSFYYWKSTVLLDRQKTRLLYLTSIVINHRFLIRILLPSFFYRTNNSHMFASLTSRRLLQLSTPIKRSVSSSSSPSSSSGAAPLRRIRRQPNKGRSPRRKKSTISSEEAGATAVAEDAAAAAAPTNTQLWRIFSHAALPMIGFGFTDQTVMIQAGNAIDCTLGVTFGLSTLTAAAFGQICSDASGVIFGGTVERIAQSMGLPSANLTNAQRVMPVVSRVRWAGSFIGIIVGCCLGLVNLLFIDTNQSSTLKLNAFNDEQEFEFQIEASNAGPREDATMLTVKGPDVDGILASMTAALAAHGASIVAIHAEREECDKLEKQVNDVFYVVKRGTGEPFGDDELEDLAEELLNSTRTPMNVNSVKAAMNELETTNTHLQTRVHKLEKLMREYQITVVDSTGKETHHHP